MADLPVVCTLNPAARAARQERLLANLVRRAGEHLEIANGHRLKFQPAEDVLPTLARTVDLERQCCRFLQFTITVEPDGGEISLDLTGPAGTHEFLAALMEL